MTTAQKMTLRSVSRMLQAVQQDKTGPVWYVVAEGPIAGPDSSVIVTLQEGGGRVMEFLLEEGGCLAELFR